MRNIFITLLFVLIFSSCRGQSGGLGFWNPPDSAPAPGDTVIGYMPYRPFLVNREGSDDVMYLCDWVNSRVIRYQGQANIKAARGRVIIGSDIITGPQEIKLSRSTRDLYVSNGSRIIKYNLDSKVSTPVYTPSDTAWYPVTFTPTYDVVNDENTLWIIVDNDFDADPGYFNRTLKMYTVSGLNSVDYFHYITGSPGVSQEYVRYLGLVATGTPERPAIITNIRILLGNYFREVYVWNGTQPTPGMQPHLLYDELIGDYLGNAVTEAYSPQTSTIEWKNGLKAVMGSGWVSGGYSPFFERVLSSGAIEPIIPGAPVNSQYYSSIMGATNQAMYIMTHRTDNNVYSLLRNNENGTNTVLRQLQ